MDLISKYRSELMGIAIIWVILYHLILTQNSPYSFGFLDSILGNGYEGVDIFLYLSGFGLVRSWNKCLQQNHSHAINLFYKRRILRLAPTYIFICILYSIYQNNWNTLFYSISTIGHWINHNRYDWYVPTILLLYLSFPILYKLIQKYKFRFLIISFIIILLVTISFNYLSITNDLRMLSISRIPIFILGIYHGICPISYFNRSYYFRNTILMFIGLVLLFSLKHSPLRILFCGGLYQLTFLFITPGLCHIISWTLNTIKLPILNRILSLLGILSYELYLIHLKLIENIVKLPFFGEINHWVYFTILIILIITISYMTNKLMHIILNIISKIKFSI